MKTLSKLLLLLVPAGMMFTACEGPQGLQGVDANQSCTECHNNSVLIETKQAQWDESLHAKGENAAYANRTGCVQCHTSQGFLEAVKEGSTADLTIPTDPQQINCYTCHKIHDTYTSSDFALTKPGAENLIVKYAGNTVTWDKGKSNQCVGCHQAREINPAPVKDGPDFVITSANTRLGLHHAPMSNIILGKIPFELAGASFPTANPHSTTNGCIDCHMAKPYGYQAGGHSMNMEYTAHGTPALNSTGCLVCHTAETATSISTKLATLQTSIDAKLATLQTKLTAAGIYNATTGLAKAGTFKANVVLAYLDYNTITEDKSKGLHNPNYTKTLLDNAITTLTSLGY